MDEGEEEPPSVCNSNTPEIEMLPENRLWGQDVVIQEHGKRLVTALYVMLTTSDFPLEKKSSLEKATKKKNIRLVERGECRFVRAQKL